jgi:hypothetical protein
VAELARAESRTAAFCECLRCAGPQKVAKQPPGSTRPASTSKASLQEPLPRRGYRHFSLPQSSSASRVTAAQAGFFTLSQSGERSERVAEPLIRDGSLRRKWPEAQAEQVASVHVFSSQEGAETIPRDGVVLWGGDRRVGPRKTLGCLPPDFFRGGAGP